MSSRPVLAAGVLLAVSLVALSPSAAEACPFCAAQSQTLGEEIAANDAAVLAKLVSPAKPPMGDEVAKATFEVVELLREASGVKVGDKVQTIYFGSAPVGTTFLVTAIDPPNLIWSTPLAVTEQSAEYIRQMVKLPMDGPDRLAFVQKFLEHKEELLARDAYDEFARAPYDAVKGLKDRMDHKQLIHWIGDLEIPASRRRLYLTMLGVCGTKDDVPMLEEMLRSTDRRLKAGLDAMIACYLTLRGPDGMGLVEELFLKNPNTEYSDTYAAIMALRFHGTESETIPKARILQGLHLMLARPPLADLVIPDLARWEDWSQVDRLVELFKKADDKSSWVKIPVINYLKACPLAVAKQRLDELKALDPETFKQAETFFPFGPMANPAAKPAAAATGPAESDQPAKPVAGPAPVGTAPAGEGDGT